MKLRQYISCVVIAVLLLAAPANSVDWLNYVEGKGGDMFYVDMDSIKSTPANMIRIIKKVEYVGSSKIDSIQSEIEMDCKNSMISYLKDTTYFKDGKSHGSSNNKKFRKVTIEDDDESLMELICSLKKSR